MSIKLFAHVLWGAAHAAPAPALPRSLDLRSWVWRELVARRRRAGAWDSPAAPQSGDVRPRRAVAIEPVWVDTQPWCHE